MSSELLVWFSMKFVVSRLRLRWWFLSGWMWSFLDHRHLLSPGHPRCIGSLDLFAVSGSGSIDDGASFAVGSVDIRVRNLPSWYSFAFPEFLSSLPLEKYLILGVVQA